MMLNSVPRPSVSGRHHSSHPTPFRRPSSTRHLASQFPQRRRASFQYGTPGQPFAADETFSNKKAWQSACEWCLNLSGFIPTGCRYSKWCGAGQSLLREALDSDPFSMVMFDQLLMSFLMHGSPLQGDPLGYCIGFLGAASARTLAVRHTFFIC